MNVLLVNGSPHREGCTHTALCTVSGALRQNGIGTDLFWIGTKPLSGCLACHRCDTLNQCVLQDTVNDFLALAGAYDGFVFGTPVHWGGAGGAITSFLDRAFYADLNGGGHRFLGKPAAAVTSARRAGTTATWDQMNKYFGLMQMPIIWRESSPWSSWATIWPSSSSAGRPVKNWAFPRPCRGLLSIPISSGRKAMLEPQDRTRDRSTPPWE